jgi:2,4-dienoyl-CoA reductase-like NADH-dependent reductase (Old Yellow Enzyme family)
MKISIQTPNDSTGIHYLINGIKIPSRFFFAPINTGYSNEGVLLKEFTDFYKERSGTEIGINYVGNVAIGPKYVTNQNTAYFTDQLEEWIKLTNIISQKGSTPGIQLACRNSTLTPNVKMINNKKEEYINRVQNDINSVSVNEINEIINLFIESAIKAYKVGFKVLQIHAAHGYFLSQLLNERLNLRSDEYGFDKLRVLKDIIRGIRKKLGHDVIIDIRISLLEGLISEQEELLNKKELIDKIVDEDIDIISISNGIYDINKQLIYPLKNWGHGVFISKVLPHVKEHSNVLWNVAGNIWDLSELDLKNMPNNLTYSIGRALIADPRFVQKSINHNKQGINHCERKNKCHYYSLGKEHIGCPIYEATSK